MGSASMPDHGGDDGQHHVRAAWRTSASGVVEVQQDVRTTIVSDRPQDIASRCVGPGS